MSIIDMADLIIEKMEGFDGHKMVIYVYHKESGLRGFIAIHKGTQKIPAFGATRIWHYSSEKEALNDALKLSKTMSYKIALAGLKYGGAKGVIIANSLAPSAKKKLLQVFAGKVNYLAGHFITGADVGVTREDVAMMRRISPYMVGVHADPVKFTGLGIYYGIQSCLKAVYSNESINGRSFAIQGVGKIGTSLLEFIYKEAGDIYITDVNKNQIKNIQARFPRVKVVSSQEIHKQPVDIFSPCALSNCLTESNVTELTCKIVAGGANGQLSNEKVGDMLHKRNILHAPDYVINAGGLIAVVDEYEHARFSEARVVKKVKGIKGRLLRIIRASEKQHISTNIIASQIADKLIRRYT